MVVSHVGQPNESNAFWGLSFSETPPFGGINRNPTFLGLRFLTLRHAHAELPGEELRCGHPVAGEQARWPTLIYTKQALKAHPLFRVSTLLKVGGKAGSRLHVTGGTARLGFLQPMFVHGSYA